MKMLFDIIDIDLDIDILGIEEDSRKVKDGYLFVATKGYNVDHFDYINDAIDRGAVFVICDREIPYDFPHYVVEKNINEFYIECCKKFYDLDLSNFNFIGVTGTDGKTTTTTIVQRLLDDCAYIGTNGMAVNKKIYDTSNTTPCISELYSDLKKIEIEKCKYISMEVSSEALLHKRVNGFLFDVVGFTNITEEHLNIHKTIEEYRNIKFTLIDLLKENGVVLVNGDDENCRMLKCQNMYTFGFENDNDYVIKNVKKMSKFVKFDIVCKENKYTIYSPLKEKYNIYNVTLAFLICLYKGVDSNLLIERIKNIGTIAGRCEYLDFGQKYDIILDYAHTLNGINNILDSVKNYKNIIVVTGAAGGREKEKRVKIGKALLDKANTVIFTMDDPRNESVDDIIEQMVGEDKRAYLRIVDRTLAIKKALELADDDSVVLILGKGRDNYMAIGDEKVPYSDYEVLKNIFNY